jgi:hypothetical protein
MDYPDEPKPAKPARRPGRRIVGTELKNLLASNQTRRSIMTRGAA